MCANHTRGPSALVVPFGVGLRDPEYLFAALTIVTLRYGIFGPSGAQWQIDALQLHHRTGKIPGVSRSKTVTGDWSMV